MMKKICYNGLSSSACKSPKTISEANQDYHAAWDIEFKLQVLPASIVEHAQALGSQLVALELGDITLRLYNVE